MQMVHLSTHRHMYISKINIFIQSMEGEQCLACVGGWGFPQDVLLDSSHLSSQPDYLIPGGKPVSVF